MAVPDEIRGRKYISLATFRKTGTPVYTPVWFGEKDDKLYVMTRSDSGKYKRLENNPGVRVAPCTIRGKIAGPTFEATARFLPQQEWREARKIIGEKYWMVRIPLVWSKKNAYLVIEFPPSTD